MNTLRFVSLGTLLVLLFAIVWVPAALGSDLVAIDQPWPELGIAPRGDDEKLIGIGDDHLSQVVMEHVRAGQDAVTG